MFRFWSLAFQPLPEYRIVPEVQYHILNMFVYDRLSSCCNFVFPTVSLSFFNFARKLFVSVSTISFCLRCRVVKDSSSATQRIEKQIHKTAHYLAWQTDSTNKNAIFQFCLFDYLFPNSKFRSLLCITLSFFLQFRFGYTVETTASASRVISTIWSRNLAISPTCWS